MKYCIILLTLTVSAFAADAIPAVSPSPTEARLIGSGIPSEEITLPAPMGSMSVRNARTDEPAQFSLFAERAEFSFNGRKMDIPFGAKRFAVHSGYADYDATEAGERRFRFYDMAAPVTFAIEGKRFGIDTGGSLTAVRQNSDWVFSTVKGISDNQPTVSVMVRPAVEEKPVKVEPKKEFPKEEPKVEIQPLVVVAPAVPAKEEPTGVYASEEERVMAELRGLPKEDLTFRGTTIPQVFAFLARKSGISFVTTNFDAIQAGAPGAAAANSSPTSISKGFENPFAFLQIIAAEAGYTVDMIPGSISGKASRGVWTLRSLEKEGLIARTYKIRYNNLEKISASGGSAGSSSGVQQGSQSMGSGSMGGSSSGVNPGANTVFESDATRLKTEVQAILELTDPGLVVAGDTDFTRSDMELNKELDNLGVPKVRRSISSTTQASSKNKVFFSEASNALFVIGTRQQHEWVRGYLRSIDRPLKNVLLEVKLVETSRSPAENYGIKYPKEMDMTLVSKSWLTAKARTSSEGTDSGSGFTYDPAEAVFPVTPVEGVAGGFPLTGMITADQLKMTLSALKENSEGTNISYYYTGVTENREVVLKNTVQTPILAASAQVSTGSSGTSGNSGTSGTSAGVGGTSSQSVQYRDIGLILNMRPSVSENIVNLELSLELSSIAGNISILGVSYPQPAVRAYKGPVRIRSGDSLAIGGLDDSVEQLTTSGLPVLSDLPLFGRLFGHKSMSKTKRHLLIFVTPIIQDGYSSGVEGINRGTSLGDWRPYSSGSVNDLVGLRKACSGLVPYVNMVEQMFYDGTLNKAHLGDVNGLFADISAILQDYDALVRGKSVTEGDAAFFAQMKFQRTRVERLRNALMQNKPRHLLENN